MKQIASNYNKFQMNQQFDKFKYTFIFKIMNKPKLRKVNFKIIDCSSEDPEYPVTQLLRQAPNAKGWQNKRFSTYPQIVSVQLEESTLLKKVTFLSHQFKITKRIELQAKLNKDQEWKKLGYVSLGSNENTNFNTRQLRTANLQNTPALFMRLIFRQNYLNNRNLFNQVGLISVCINGDRFEQNLSSEPKLLTKNLSNNLGLQNIIKQLQLKKKIAVQNQQYQLAQEIKQQILQMKKSGQVIIQLQRKKQQAIQQQNYEDAKIFNEQIKKLKSGKNNQIITVKQQSAAISPSTYVQPKCAKSQINNQDRPLTIHQNKKKSNNDDEYIDKHSDNEPEQLNKQLYKQCSEFFHVINEETFCMLFSKDHTNRQNGLNILSQIVKKGSSNRQLFILSCLYILKNLIDDKIASVLLMVIQLMGIFMKKIKPSSNSSNLPYVEYILEKMADYLGHNNEKIRSCTEQVYASLPIYHLTNKQVCFKVLSTMSKRDKPPKILIGRLKMLNRLTQQYQLGNNYIDIIKYAVKYADDKNNQVRIISATLLITIINEIGYQLVQNHLKNLKPQIIKNIEDKIGNNKQVAYDDKPIKIKNKGNYELEQVDNEFIEFNNQKQNRENICEYCGRMDKRFIEQDYKDLHLYNGCPLLAICFQCNQAIQISALTSHQVGQCVNSNYYKKCPRCKEAVHQKNYKTHVQRKQCLSAKPLAVANRCPLCHIDIQPGVKGWKSHLVHEGCQNNPRS